MTDIHPHQGQSIKKDTLFRDNPYPRSGFVFDNQVVEVFDDMLHRSIPHYQEVMHLSCDYLLSKGPGGIVYDLGSSTGNFLLSLARLDHTNKYRECYGIDRSPDMVRKAEKKYADLMKPTSWGTSDKSKVAFLCDDLLHHHYQNCGGITLHYTLQFISPDRRLELIEKIHSALLPGGLIVLSEKVVEDAITLRDYFIDRHHRFKTTNDYTTDEIARKKEALENVLIPFTTTHYETLLKQVGFREVAIAFKWFNFVTWLAVK